MTVVPDSLVYGAVVQEYRPIVLPLELLHATVETLRRLVEKHLEREIERERERQREIERERDRER